jgi:hypothetical protein
MILVSIDPGAGGAIARKSTNDNATVINMPSTLRDIWDSLNDMIPEGEPCLCLCEKVGTYWTGNSGPAAATFAEHVGSIKAFLVALAITHEFVTPWKWQAMFIGKQTYTKLPEHIRKQEGKRGGCIRGCPTCRALRQRKTERKNKIKAKAQQVFPGLNITLKNADALGILYYGLSVYVNEGSSGVVSASLGQPVQQGLSL